MFKDKLWPAAAILVMVLSISGGMARAAYREQASNQPRSPKIASQPAVNRSLPKEIMPLSEVRRGMKGIARTVFTGTKIDEFAVEVLGVLKQQGPAGDLILVRVSGPAIDKSGGIAAGMSGSPVYINGRLVGAIGFGFDFADHRIGMVTPIEPMLKVMDLASGQPTVGKTVSLAEPVWIGGREIRRVVFAAGSEEARRMMQEAGTGTMVMAPAATPVMVGGLSGRSLDRLKKVLEPLNLVPVQAGGKAPAAPKAALEPGSAFGVQLVRGDVDMTAIGTLTYRDGQKFVGFGHPFMNKGNANYFVTPAYIYETVPSLQAPFKIGGPGEPVGTLLQDRSAGVAGIFGRIPGAILLQTRVYDRDLKQERKTGVEIIRDNRLTLEFAGAAALQGMDRGIDRIGQGMAKVTFEIDGKGLPHDVLKRENIFFSDADISAVSLSEFMEALDLILNNEFRNVEVQNIKFNAEVWDARETAKIEKAQPERKEVRPGQEVSINVLVRPYRGEPFNQKLALAIPRDIQPGTVTVTVRGGGLGIVTPPSDGYQAAGDRKGKDGKETKGENQPKTNYENLEKLVSDLMQREKNSDLVAEFYPPSGSADGGAGEGEEAFAVGNAGNLRPVALGSGQPAAGDPRYVLQKPRPLLPWEASDPKGASEVQPKAGMPSQEPVKSFISTPYVIEGMAEFDLTVSSGSEETPEDSDLQPEEGPAPEEAPVSQPGRLKPVA